MLKDKIAVITGSSRGIGNAIAEEYLKNGAKVVICGSKKENAERAPIFDTYRKKYSFRLDKI